MSDAVRDEIVSIVAANPTVGDLMVGTGGLRKFRHAKPGTGKSGGYRVLVAHLGNDLPAFLIGVFGKNQKDNLTKDERNEIAKRLRTMKANYPKKKGGKK